MSDNLDKTCTFLFELYEYQFGKDSFEKSIPNMIANIANKNFNVFYNLVTDCDNIAYIDEEFNLLTEKIFGSYRYIREETYVSEKAYITLYERDTSKEIKCYESGKTLISPGDIKLPGYDSIIENKFREYIKKYWIKLREKYTIDEITKFSRFGYMNTKHKIKTSNFDDEPRDLELYVFTFQSLGIKDLKLIDVIRLEYAKDKFPKSYDVIGMNNYKNTLEFIKTIELSFNDICRWCYERKYGSIKSKIERINNFDLELKELKEVHSQELNELKSEMNSRVEEVEKANSEEKAKMEKELLEVKAICEDLRVFAESQSLKCEDLEIELEKSKSSAKSLEIENSELREKLKSILSLKEELLK